MRRRAERNDWRRGRHQAQHPPTQHPPAQVLRRRAERNIASGSAPGAAPGGAPPPRSTPPSPRRLLHISKSESEAPGDGHALSIIIPGNGHSYSQTFTTQISVMPLGPFSLAGVGKSYIFGTCAGRSFSRPFLTRASPKSKKMTQFWSLGPQGGGPRNARRWVRARLGQHLSLAGPYKSVFFVFPLRNISCNAFCERFCLALLAPLRLGALRGT